MELPGPVQDLGIDAVVVKRPRGRPRKNRDHDPRPPGCIPIPIPVRRPRGRPRKKPALEQAAVKRPVGRPRKTPYLGPNSDLLSRSSGRKKKRHDLEPDASRVERYRQAYEAMVGAPEGSVEQRKYRKRILDNLDDFMSNCLWINSQMNPDQESRLQLLIPNNSQKMLLQTIAEIERRGDPVRIIILKARQKGLSTGISAWILSQLATHPHTKGAVMAHEKEAGEGLFAMYVRMFNGLKDQGHFPLEKGQGSRYRRHLNIDPVDSSLQVLVANEPGHDDVGDTGRSTTFQYLHCSEVPFWNNASSALKSLRQCVHRVENTAIFLESTAKAYGDTFHQQWLRAFDKKQATLYVPLFFPWFVDDEYRLHFEEPEKREAFAGELRDNDTADFGNEVKLMEAHSEITLEHLNWRRWKLTDELDMDLHSFQREFPSEPDEAFQGSAGNWLSPMIMSRYKQKVEPPLVQFDFDDQERQWNKKPRLLERRDGLVKIWKHPEPYCGYVVGSDSAEGNDNGDFSVAYVMRRMPPGIVAELRGQDFRRCGQSEFAQQLYWLAKYYNEAWVNPESNYGQVIVAVLADEIGYKNIFQACDLNLGQRPLSRQKTRLGWWKSSVTALYVQPRTKEWFQGRKVSMESDLKYCPVEELIDEAMNCIVDDGGMVRAPKKGMPRRPGTPDAGYYDDRLHAFYGCILADLSLPSVKMPDEVEEEEESSVLDELDLLTEETHRYGYAIGRSYPYQWLAERPSWRRENA